MSHLGDERVDSGSEGENKEEIFYMFYISLNVNFRIIHPGPARRLARRGHKYWQQPDSVFLGHWGRGTGDKMTVGPPLTSV